MGQRYGKRGDGEPVSLQVGWCGQEQRRRRVSLSLVRIGRWFHIWGGTELGSKMDFLGSDGHVPVFGGVGRRRLRSLRTDRRRRRRQWLGCEDVGDERVRRRI
ncbi:hypothetical protein M0R45_030846 [Rubus argutus]|uniref:Uncharacterized protein n=1 Tax=Rubus argutus TaxID=59490 RepID=A0AAW1WCK2_RUBAR